ncbi:MAG: hypothetical protein ACK5BR_07635 [Bacteroidota bacterium]|jgi:hypothetical protein
MKSPLKKLALLLILCLTVSLSSCKLSTEELAKEVQVSMEETWDKEGVTGISIQSFTLTHKSGNEYSGILETLEDGESMKYTVEVIYDGENMQWEIVE